METQTRYAVADPKIPYDIETEQALLGCVLLDNDALLLISTTPDEFYLEKHQYIFKAMQALNADCKPVDLLTLCRKLESSNQLNDCGSAAYLTSLINAVPSALNIKAYAERIERLSIRRKLIESAGKIAGIAYEDNNLCVEELIQKSIGMVACVENANPQSVGFDLLSAVNEFMPEFDAYIQGEKENWGVPTGLVDLDNVIGGLAYGEMTLIAADPGKGKTMLATTIWMNAGRHGYAGAFFSLEMKRRQLMLRLFAERGNVDTSRIRRGKLNALELKNTLDGIGQIENCPLWIFDAPMSTQDILRAILRLQRKVNLRFAIVDYSDLLSDTGETEVVRMKRISHALKNTAKQTGIALAVVHPITRDASQQNEPPQLHHLGWGRAWEYDAHTVLFPHFDNKRTNYDACIKIGKYRDGIAEKKLPVIFDGKRWGDKAHE